MTETDRRLRLLRCRVELQAWQRQLGEAVAEAVALRLEAFRPEILVGVDPAIITRALVEELTSHPTTQHALRRAHRWAVAQQETMTP